MDINDDDDGNDIGMAPAAAGDDQAPAKTLSRIRRALDAALLAVGMLAMLSMGYALYLVRTTPSIDALRAAQNTEPSKLLAADGSLLAEFSRNQQTRVALKDVSPFAIRALIDTEDHRFYRHGGVDILRTVASAWHTLHGDIQGGSTITQQLARNLFPEIGTERTVGRKLREMVTALKIERAFSKDEILESYLNNMPFLYHVVGIEMAARTYFGKSAATLSEQQSATLVGMLKGTYYYNPVTYPARARARRNLVLGQMRKYDDLSAQRYAMLVEQPLGVNFTRPSDDKSIAPHFAAFASKWLTTWAEAHDYDLYADGLIVETTLDTRLQKAATEAVERQTQALQNVADVEWAHSALTPRTNAVAAYAQMRKHVAPFGYFWNSHRDLVETFMRDTPEYRSAIAAGATPADALSRLHADATFMTGLRANKTRLEAGFVALDPASGEVRAWVGSRDFTHDQFDHVALAERQPGSTFKPIVYGAALERGLPPQRRYHDTPMEYRQSDGSVWRPTDMSGASGGSMSLSDGLVYSKNTITAQVMEEVGIPSVVSLARAVGIRQSRLDAVPSLALGTSPVTLLEMATAYSTIADAGQYHPPVFIKRITDRHGKVLAQFDAAGERALSEESALELIDMMRGVVARGTGQAVRTRFGISADIAGKTGTTQNNTDGWFFLMHPDLVAGAWVGFNDSRVTMRGSYWGQGGHNAILLVGDFFRSALAERLIDVRQQFLRPARPQAIPVDSDATGWDAATADDARAITTAATVPDGSIKIIHLDGNGTVIGDVTTAIAPTPDTSDPRSAPELEGMLSNMGRDPATGIERSNP